MWPAHDRYKASFRRLRDGEMKQLEGKVLDLVGSISFTSFSIPARDDIERIIRQGERLFGSVDAIDGALFGEIAQLLDDEQSQMVERVRGRRRLAVYRTIVGEIGPPT